jgi:hypothetical protein
VNKGKQNWEKEINVFICLTYFYYID